MTRPPLLLGAAGAALIAALFVVPTARAQSGPAVSISPQQVQSGGQLTVTITGCIRGDDPEGVAIHYIADTESGLVLRDDAAGGGADAAGTLVRTLTVPSHIGIGQFQIGGTCSDDDAAGEPDLPLAPASLVITPPPAPPVVGSLTLGSPIVDPGGTTSVLVDGLPPHEGLCSVWLDETTVLATLSCPTSGPLSTAVVVPPGTPPGSHRINAYFAAANGIVVASTPITVGPTASTSTSSPTPSPAAQQTLPETGSAAIPVAGAALFLISVGIVLCRRGRSFDR